MPNENKAGETNEVKTSQGSENPAAPEENRENVSEFEFTDTPAAEGEKHPKQEGRAEQTREQNSENARRRREAERQQELQAAREQAIIEALNGKNPYTGDEMKDSADVKEYLSMKEIEKAGGDPLADFSKFQKEKDRKAAEEAAKRETEAEWYRSDREAFVAKHPEVDLNALLSNADFNTFAKGKVGNLPLSEIYEDFIGIVQGYAEKSKKIAAQIVANRKASPGPLSTPNGEKGSFFTREQVKAMTPEEVHKNYDKIRESMTKWK